MRLRPFHSQILVFVTLVCSYFTAPAQSAAQLKADLEKATTTKARVDICYSISNRYSSFLKIDSALYFADQIKQYSEQNGYQAGIGKYWLARATALRLRTKFEEAQDNLRKAIAIFEQEKDFLFLGRAYQTLASTYSIQGQNEASINFYRTAIQYTTLAGDSLTLGKQYFEIGKAFYHFYRTIAINSLPN